MTLRLFLYSQSRSRFPFFSTFDGNGNELDSIDQKQKQKPYSHFPLISSIALSSTEIDPDAANLLRDEFFTHIPITNKDFGTGKLPIDSPELNSFDSFDASELVIRERQLISSYNKLATDLNYTGDIQLIEKALENLDSPFLIVTVGEFNSGKSTFTNALLGDHFLPEGIVPTTNNLHLIKYGSKVVDPIKKADYVIHTFPVQWLKVLNIVDTPGTNAIFQRHQKLTEAFIPRADLILFITSVDKPLSESERNFITKIENWGKKIVFIVNKIDSLPLGKSPGSQSQSTNLGEYGDPLSSQFPPGSTLSEMSAFPKKLKKLSSQLAPDINTLLNYISDNLSETVGIRPDIYPVSSRFALKSKILYHDSMDTKLDPKSQTKLVNQANSLWDASGFPELESFIFQSLDSSSRWKLKLQNPLNVTNLLHTKYSTTIHNAQIENSKSTSLVTGFHKLVDSQITEFNQQFQTRWVAQVDDIFSSLSTNCHAFLSTEIRWEKGLSPGWWYRLFTSQMNDPSKPGAASLRIRFEKQVIGDLEHAIEIFIRDLVEFIIEWRISSFKELSSYLYKHSGGTSGSLNTVSGQTKMSPEVLKEAQLLAHQLQMNEEDGEDISDSDLNFHDSSAVHETNITKNEPLSIALNPQSFSDSHLFEGAHSQLKAILTKTQKSIELNPVKESAKMKECLQNGFLKLGWTNIISGLLGSGLAATAATTTAMAFPLGGAGIVMFGSLAYIPHLRKVIQNTFDEQIQIAQKSFKFSLQQQVEQILQDSQQKAKSISFPLEKEIARKEEEWTLLKEKLSVLSETTDKFREEIANL